jgi:hypothetical protein
MSHDDVAPTRRRSLRALGTAAIATVLIVAPATAATAGGHGHGHHDKCAKQVNDTYAEVLKCVALDDVLGHLKNLQKIADRNNDPYYPGSRAAGTKGYADSVKYVSGLLRKAGYKVTLDPFEFQFVFPAVLDQITPAAASYETGAFTNSRPGRHQPDRRPGQQQRLRGDRLHRPGLQRPRGHRPRAARHVQLRHQGAAGPGGRRRGRGDLQPGQRPDP